MLHRSQQQAASLSDEAWRTRHLQDDEAEEEEDGHHTEHYLVPIRCLHMLRRTSDPQLRAIELLSRCQFRTWSEGPHGEVGRLSLRYRDGSGDPRVCERLLNSFLAQRGARLQPLQRGSPSTAAATAASVAAAAPAAAISSFPDSTASDAVALAVAAAAAARLVACDLLRGSTFVHCCGIAYAVLSELGAPPDNPRTPARRSPTFRVCNCVRLQLLAEWAVAFEADAAAADVAAVGFAAAPADDASAESGGSLASAAAASPASFLALRLRSSSADLSRYNQNSKSLVGGDSVFVQCPLRSYPATSAVRVATHSFLSLAALPPLGMCFAEAAVVMVTLPPLEVAAVPDPQSLAFRRAWLCDNLQLPPPPLPPPPPPPSALQQEKVAPALSPVLGSHGIYAGCCYSGYCGSGGSHFRPSVDPRWRRIHMLEAQQQQQQQQGLSASTDYLSDSVSVGSTEMLTHF